MAAVNNKQIGLMDEGQEQTFFCPTFSSYSSDKLAEIAARVSNEFKKESAEKAEMFIQEDDDDDDDDDEFEFSLVLDDDSSNVFYDGKPDHPIFPIFKLDFLADKGVISHERDDDHHDQTSDELAGGGIQNIPLKELLKREREQHQVSDDIANIPPGTYCVWKPKLKESSQKMCKKSKSTGSMSKKWKILDLLRQSNSQGNESYLFLTPKHREKSVVKTDHPPPQRTRQQSYDDVVKRSGARKTPPSSPSAHQTFYVRNRAIREEVKKKSYLPYRQVLVGFFANVSGLKKTYPPF